MVTPTVQPSRDACADDLVEGVDGVRPADLRDRLHVGLGGEQLHAERQAAQLEQPRQLGCEPSAVCGGDGHDSFPGMSLT